MDATLDTTCVSPLVNVSFRNAPVDVRFHLRHEDAETEVCGVAEGELITLPDKEAYPIETTATNTDGARNLYRLFISIAPANSDM